MAYKTPLDWKTLFESERFQRETTYNGPLGAQYTPAGTTLTLWAPTADRVAVRLYSAGDGGFVQSEQPMLRGGCGQWSITLDGDRSGQYYTYLVTVDGKTEETIDPYARAAGLNGTRSMVVDLPTTDPAGWEEDARPVIPEYKRVVWEGSVRDFSADPASGVRLSWRGKYLAFTQENTTLSFDGVHPTCLAYLKRLGITYVQLMPFYDFGSVDEGRNLTNQYNWGYDPVNYNVPEGSYSTDPRRGEVRIREVKQMVAALHKAGIGVVMDVVYNHMYRWENPMNACVPYYYFRQSADGTPSNGSGCGNEVATERAMVRRYIVDSLVYWAKEYHLDGFRFDLMGLYDAETMNLIRAELDKLPGGKDILMYGEPWQAGGSTISVPAADKEHLPLLDERIGVFCDNTRDSIKGHCFEGRAPGYVSGNWDCFWDVCSSVAAWCRSYKLQPKSPRQIVSYVSAHDNYTLWDKLALVADSHPDYAERSETLLAQNRLCAGIYLTCKGLPFMQAGEEFARTKLGDENSYISRVGINRLDWNRANEYHDLVDYYRGLIALRGAFPQLGDMSRDSAEAIQFFHTEAPLIGWQIAAMPGDDTPWQALAVYYNPENKPVTITLPAGDWQMLSDGVSSSLWRNRLLRCSGEVVLKPVSATILGRLTWPESPAAPVKAEPKAEAASKTTAE